MGEYTHPFPPWRPAYGSLWKLLRSGLKHGAHTYRPGRMQVLPSGESFVPEFGVAEGGFYLTPFEAIPKWLQLHDDLEFIAPAWLGRTSRFIRSRDRIKTDSFVLGYPRFLWKFVQDFFNRYEIIMRNPYNIRFYRDNADTVQMEDAVKADPHTLQFIYPQPMWISILAVERNGLALRHVRYKTPEICLAAVKQNGLALAYVEKQYSKARFIRAEETDPILMAAVSQNGMALTYVKDKIPELCEMAVKQAPMALMYVPEENKSFELCQIAYQGNPEAIQYVPESLKGRVQCGGKYAAFAKSFVLH